MKFKFKIGDIIIIATVLVVTGVLVYFVYFNSKPGPIAVIYNVENRLANIAEIDLRKTKNGSYKYHDGKGNIDLTVEVKDGKIAMTDIECPDKVCVHTGFIGNSMMPIICLPNKIIIEVLEEDDKNLVDKGT